MHSNINNKSVFNFIVAQSMAASFVSAPISIDGMDDIGIQLNFDIVGVPVGTFTIQGTVDGLTWFDLDMGTTTPSTADGSPIAFDLVNCTYIGLRVVYTRTSGAGTLNGFAFGKSV